jgi:phage terminase large subunit-like protein
VVPEVELHGGDWGKAFNGQRLELRFKNGSTIAFKTYKQDPSTLGGAALHWVGYDEPPPRKHREECRMRLADYGGFEMFAMTPLETNTGYVRREVWKKRESPHITVVKGSIHDNPMLDKKTVELTLGDMSDLWRRASEFGDFVDVGGLIYPDFERCVQEKPFDPAFIRTLDVIVAIDPGIRNAGVVFEGFDNENVCHIFDELLFRTRRRRTTPQLSAECSPDGA